MIISVIIILLLIPLVGVVSDYHTGKIRNQFVGSFFVGLIILSGLLDWFYSSAQAYSDLIVFLLFGFVFYRLDRFGAGDGKYLWVLGFSTMIIAFLLGYAGSVTRMFFLVFAGCSIAVISILIWDQRQKAWAVMKHIPFHVSFAEVFSVVVQTSFFLVISFFIGKILPVTLDFLLYFLLFSSLGSSIGFILRSGFIRVMMVIGAIVLMVYSQWFVFAGAIFGITILLNTVSFIVSQVYDTIDRVSIKLGDIKGWMILSEMDTENLLSLVPNLPHGPLQPQHIFDIIEAAKKQHRLQDFVFVYRDFRIAAILYGSYLMTVAWIVVLRFLG